MTTNSNQTRNFGTEKKRKRNGGFELDLRRGKERSVNSEKDLAKVLAQLVFQRRERKWVIWVEETESKGKMETEKIIERNHWTG